MAIFSSSDGTLASTGRDDWSWPVLLLLLAVLVPSGGVIWMMRQAMENERLAVRQRMTDLYQLQLESSQQSIEKSWKQRLAEIDLKVASELFSVRFSRLVTEGVVDSVIIWSDDGKVLYPDRLERSPKANAELRQLTTLDPLSPDWNSIVNRLRNRLNRYDSKRLSAPQRRFLMRELTERWPTKFEFPMMDAEFLAADFIENSSDKTATAELKRTAIEGVWSWHSLGSETTALFYTSTIQQVLDCFLTDQRLPEGIVLQVLPPSSTTVLQTVSLSPVMPGWRLAITSSDERLNGDSERVALFAWTALALIAATVFLTWLVVRSWWQQMRVARLKNDLVATVTHELRTPLSSIRLLVDTLLDQEGEATDLQAIQGRTREYLELISQENSRLTRLIDNFLTFSRIKQGKRPVKLASIDAREVIVQAADAVRERFNVAEDCELVVELGEGASVRGDIDLLVTCVVNLLDNAWKYSGESKRVHLSCKQQGENIVIRVEDNGIGLPSQLTEKVFNRFYQVDQRLSRPQEGCGLGLSIVKYLVEAHHGEVTVKSQPDVGSVFSISLPIDKAAAEEGNQR